MLRNLAKLPFVIICTQPAGMVLVIPMLLWGAVHSILQSRICIELDDRLFNLLAPNGSVVPL